MLLEFSAPLTASHSVISCGKLVFGCKQPTCMQPGVLEAVFVVVLNVAGVQGV